MTCKYIPEITAEFGRTITDAEINREFEAIQRAFECFEEQIGINLLEEDTIFNHGIIDNSYTIDPAFGVIHYMEIQGDTELHVLEPPEGTPRLITLIINNAGAIETDNYGRFNFKSGVVWTANRDDVMDGKPWNMYANLTGLESGTQYEGFYGAVVQCIHDGVGWIFLIYARHHLDIFNPAIPEDIYSWR